MMNVMNVEIDLGIGSENCDLQQELEDCEKEKQEQELKRKRTLEHWHEKEKQERKEELDCEKEKEEHVAAVAEVAAAVVAEMRADKVTAKETAKEKAVKVMNALKAKAEEKAAKAKAMKAAKAEAAKAEAAKAEAAKAEAVKAEAVKVEMDEKYGPWTCAKEREKFKDAIINLFSQFLLNDNEKEGEKCMHVDDFTKDEITIMVTNNLPQWCCALTDKYTGGKEFSYERHHEKYGDVHIKHFISNLLHSKEKKGEKPLSAYDLHRLMSYFERRTTLAALFEDTGLLDFAKVRFAPDKVKEDLMEATMGCVHQTIRLFFQDEFGKKKGDDATEFESMTVTMAASCQSSKLLFRLFKKWSDEDPVVRNILGLPWENFMGKRIKAKELLEYHFGVPLCIMYGTEGDEGIFEEDGGLDGGITDRLSVKFFMRKPCDKRCGCENWRYKHTPQRMPVPFSGYSSTHHIRVPPRTTNGTDRKKKGMRMFDMLPLLKFTMYRYWDEGGLFPERVFADTYTHVQIACEKANALAMANTKGSDDQQKLTKLKYFLAYLEASVESAVTEAKGKVSYFRSWGSVTIRKPEILKQEILKQKSITSSSSKIDENAIKRRKVEYDISQSPSSSSTKYRHYPHFSKEENNYQSSSPSTSKRSSSQQPSSEQSYKKQRRNDNESHHPHSSKEENNHRSSSPPSTSQRSSSQQLWVSPNYRGGNPGGNRGGNRGGVSDLYSNKGNYHNNNNNYHNNNTNYHNNNTNYNFRGNNNYNNYNNMQNKRGITVGAGGGRGRGIGRQSNRITEFANYDDKPQPHYYNIESQTNNLPQLTATNDLPEPLLTTSLNFVHDYNETHDAGEVRYRPVSPEYPKNPNSSNPNKRRFTPLKTVTYKPFIPPPSSSPPSTPVNDDVTPKFIPKPTYKAVSPPPSSPPPSTPVNDDVTP